MTASRAGVFCATDTATRFGARLDFDIHRFSGRGIHERCSYVLSHTAFNVLRSICIPICILLQNGLNTYSISFYPYLQSPPNSSRLHSFNPRHSSTTESSNMSTSSAAPMSSLTKHRSHDSTSSIEARSAGIPLIDLSPTPSPEDYRARRNSHGGTGSDVEDDDIPISLRPLVSPQQGSIWKRLFANGGVGQFLLSTWTGWQVYVGLLVIYTCGAEFALVLMNRFVLWSRHSQKRCLRNWLT